MIQKIQIIFKKLILPEFEKNSNIKSPKSTLSPIDSNYKSTENLEYNLYGSIYGIDKKSPKNENFDYKLIGEIP